jgi:predicted acyl esterase
MAKKVTIEVGGEAGTQHRWSCLSCATMGPWTHQTMAVAGGEEHGDQHPDEGHEVHHRDEDLDEILQNLTGPIQSDPPSDETP